MTLKYDQTIRENTMSMNGLYNSRSECGSRYDEVCDCAAQRPNMSAPDTSDEADLSASAQRARSTKAAQIANIAARLNGCR